MAFQRFIRPTAILFYSNMTILLVGMGLFPVLPYYATQFGASPALIGIYYAIINAALAAGSLAAGWLTARFNIKSVFIISGAIGTPALILVGQASHLWQVIFLTALVWLVGGLNLAIIGMLLGILTRKEVRGRTFSLLALTTPISALTGGTGVSLLVSELGYPAMFLALGLLWAGMPLSGLFLPPDAEKRQVAVPVRTGNAPRYRMYAWSEPFAAVLYISLIAAVAISVTRLGTPLAMQSKGFSATEVASTAIAGGLVAIPVVLVVSFFSDRIRRSRFLDFAYAAAGMGILVLAFSTQLWQYWISAGLMMIAFCLSGALASAVATDVLPPSELKRGLAWLNAGLPAVSILAYASTGWMADLLGFQPFFLLTALLPLAAAALLEVALQRCKRAYLVETEPVLASEVLDESVYTPRCL